MKRYPQRSVVVGAGRRAGMTYAWQQNHDRPWTAKLTGGGQSAD
ncbi:hypothetical protein [Nonomuraea dietziae]